jgi:hypothetical protein
LGTAGAGFNGGYAAWEAPMESRTVETEHQAIQVAAEAGNVILDGPNGLAATMSPDAAEETARRLVKAVGEARLQAEPGQTADT